MTLAEQFRGWLPIGIKWRDGHPGLDWCYFGGARFTEPFCEQTIARVMGNPFSCLFRHRTPLELAGELAELDPGLAPTGFVYHMSRCGSTLVSRVLTELPAHLVLSEPPVLDDALRMRDGHGAVDRATRVRWVRWIVSALGRRRFAEESRYFVKLDCWSMCDFDVIREAFPDVPWVFVYRNPIEVLVSQWRQPARYNVPGYLDASLLGLDRAAVLAMPRHEYCARILAAILNGALQHAQSHGGLLVEYRQLPEAIWGDIAAAFSLPLSPEEVAAMRAAAKLDAKSPYFEFAMDGERKQAEASAPLLETCARWLEEPYRKLEAVRKSTNRRASR